MVALGAKGLRHYAWYVRATQSQADQSIANIMALLESPQVSAYYPHMSEPLRGRYGNSRGWRRERLRTSSGFTVDAMGLDTAVRGAKVEQNRPDIIVFDDIDDRGDSADVTRRKIDVLTTSVLPAQAQNAVVLGIQNLIIPDGIFSQLADGRADFLWDRFVSGPHPAIAGAFAYERRGDRYVILSGEATWDGQDVEACEHAITTWGPVAFLREAQHDVSRVAGGIFSDLTYLHCTDADVPDLVKVVVWVDPAVESKTGDSCQAIQVDGLAEDGHIYRLFSWESHETPQGVIELAISKAVQYNASHVGIETDQGGDTWVSVVERACQNMNFRPPRSDFFLSDKAGRLQATKVERAQQMHSDYTAENIIHLIGTHDVLENALFRFPRVRPFDLVDAAFWSWNSLRNPGAGRPIVPGFLGQAKARGWS